MAPRSLAEICVRVAIVGISQISGFGDLPVSDNMREILRAVKTAEQLRSIELNTTDPLIYKETEPIWKRFIRQKFAILQRQHNWAPDKPENWHKVWDRYQETWDAAQENAIAALKAAVAANKEKQESNKATIVNASQLRGLGAKEPRKTTHWSAQQPKKPNKSFIEKARNQVRQEVSRFRPAKAPYMRPVNLGKVDHAPASMINDKRIGQQYNLYKQIAAATQIIVPRTRASTDSKSLKADRQRKEREERLLRIKNGGPKGGADKDSPTRPTILRFDDDDDDNLASVTSGPDDDFGDLFGDEPASKARSPTTTGKAKSSLLDINSIEALYTESSGSSSTRSNSDSSRRSVAGPPADRRRGGLLSAAPGASKTPARVSSTTKSPLAVGRSTAATSPPEIGRSGGPAGSPDPPAVAHKSLSSMTAEDVLDIASNTRATSAGPAGQPPSRRIIKRKQSVNPLVPSKRVRR